MFDDESVELAPAPPASPPSAISSRDLYPSPGVSEQENTQGASQISVDDPPTPGGHAAASPELLTLLVTGATMVAHEDRIAAGRAKTLEVRGRASDPSACVKCYRTDGRQAPVPKTACTHHVLCFGCAEALSGTFGGDAELADQFRLRRCEQCRQAS